jgi:hypothetical protein
VSEWAECKVVDGDLTRDRYQEREGGEAEEGINGNCRCVGEKGG